MYIEAPATTAPVAVPAAVGFVILISALAVVLLGLFPGPLLDTALRAAIRLF